MKKLVIILSVLIIFPLTIQAKSLFSSGKECSEWFMHYYINPEPDKIVPSVKYMNKSGMLDSEIARPSIFGFLAGVFRENPDKAFKWAKKLRTIKSSHYGVVVLGLWYANLPDSQKAVYEILDNDKNLDKDFEYLRNGTPLNIRDIPLKQGAWVLDALWGEFFATGKPEPIFRITEALPWVDTKGDINKLVIGGAAGWSLRSNAIQHDRVLEVLAGRAENHPEDNYLQRVINDAIQERASQMKEEVDGLNEYIGHYPPTFKDKKEKAKILSVWKTLVAEAEFYARFDPESETSFSLRTELYRQGHNMDVQGSAEKAIENLDACLGKYPRSVLCNFSAAYLYLSISPEYHNRGEKSLRILREYYSPELNPEVEAGYVFFYLYRRDVERAKKQIDLFIEKFPDNARSEEFKSMKAAIGDTIDWAKE